MSASSKKPASLKQLLVRFVETYFGHPAAVAADSAVAPEHPDEEPPGLWHRETKRVLEDIAAEIYEKHLVGAPFRGANEVSRVLERSLTSCADEWRDDLRGELQDEWREGSESHEIRDLLCDQLLKELRGSSRWEFDVMIARAGNVRVDLPIGGESNLNLYMESPGEPGERSLSPWTLRMRGEVDAHDGDGARIAIEELGATILGGAAALGIVRSDSLPTDELGRNEVRVREPKVTAVTAVSALTTDATRLWWQPFSRSRIEVHWDDLSDLERQQFDRAAPVGSGNRPERCIANRLQSLKNVMLTSDARANAVRNACKIAHASATTRDYGLAVTLAFAVIEGLLLDEKDKESTVARLAEAVAHSLGRTASERNDLRKETKSLYGERCSFIHSGGVREKARARRKTIAIMNRVLRREIESLARTA